MSTTGKKQIFKAMKFRTIKNAKFYSSEIKWAYSSKIYCIANIFQFSNKLEVGVSKIFLHFSFGKYKGNRIC